MSSAPFLAHSLWRVAHHTGDRVIIPWTHGCCCGVPSEIQVAEGTEFLNKPGGVGRRSSCAWRIIVGNVVGKRTFDLDGFFDEIPISIDHLCTDTSDARFDEVVSFEFGNELLSPPRHL